MSQKKPTIYITKGLPGSGKSFWSRNKVKESGGNVKRVNKDDLRNMMDEGEWSPSNERLVLKVRDNLINAAINSGYDVIVDDTNLHPKMERGIRALVGDRAQVEVIFFNTDLDECLKRNATRTGNALVPEKYIYEMASKWEKWQHEDCSIPQRMSDGQFSHVEQDLALPHCTIFDIDGTLARNVSRSPYDETKVAEDEVIEQVAELAKTFYHSNAESCGVNKVFIFSGRSEECREDTELWLEANEIFYDGLFMRSVEHLRAGTKDNIVKSELFDMHIKDKYYVDFIVDDRKQVKQMWVERGLFVLDVNQEDAYF